MRDADKVTTFNALMAAAHKLNEDERFAGLAGTHLTVTALGLKVVMIRHMPDGQMASAEYILAWDEIALTKFDILDRLIEEMYTKLMAAILEVPVA